MKYILIFLLPICLILLTAYSFYLKFEMSGWLAFGTFLLSYAGMNGYVHLNSYQNDEEEVETYETVATEKIN